LVGSAATGTVADAAVSPREARRLIKVERLRTEVLDVAEQEFAANGFYSTSIKTIAERCEVSVGSLYSLFADKSDLYEAVRSRHGGTLVEMIVSVADSDDPADIKLVRLAEDQVRFFRAHPFWARITTPFVTPGSRLALPGGTVAENYDRGYREAMDVQARIFAEGQRTGLLRAGDPQALARMFSAMISMHHVIDEDDSSLAMELGIEELVDLVRAAFAPAQS
jgi:AcrR family transcriptional regulator